LLLLLVGLFVFSASAAEAQVEKEFDACVGSMSDEQVDEQLAFVENSLAEQRLGAALWWSGWNGFNVFNLVYGFYRYAHSNTRLAADSWLVSAIGAGMFVADVTFLPMPGMYAYRRLSRLPSDTPEQRRHKLRRGVGLLQKAAKVEATNSDWLAHVLALVYAFTSTGYVWVRNAHSNGELTLALVLQFTTSIAVAELTFWSTPRRARRDIKVVRARTCDPLLRTVRVSEPERASIKLNLFPGQIALTARF